MRKSTGYCSLVVDLRNPLFEQELFEVLSTIDHPLAKLGSNDFSSKERQFGAK